MLSSISEWYIGEKTLGTYGTPYDTSAGNILKGLTLSTRASTACSVSDFMNWLVSPAFGNKAFRITSNSCAGNLRERLNKLQWLLGCLLKTIKAEIRGLMAEILEAQIESVMMDLYVWIGKMIEINKIYK